MDQLGLVKGGVGDIFIDRNRSVRFHHRGCVGHLGFVDEAAEEIIVGVHVVERIHVGKGRHGLGRLIIEGMAHLVVAKASQVTELPTIMGIVVVHVVVEMIHFDEVIVVVVGLTIGIE